MRDSLCIETLETRARDIASQFAQLDAVESVVLGGSVATGSANAQSDIDLYIYVSQAISLEARVDIIKKRSVHFELNAPYWETEDYWIESATAIKVEAIYRNNWLYQALEDMFEHNRAQMGFSTSLWHNVVTSKVLFDRQGYFAELKQLATRPYPDALAKAIIAKNFPLLRGSLAEYPKQLVAAVNRNDGVYIANLLYMIFASYFDILFALNHELHPGAKRQLDYAMRLNLTPANMGEAVEDILNQGTAELVLSVRHLIDELAVLLREQNAL